MSTLVVARLLSPTDYGLIGMAMVYLGLLQLVNEFGLTTPIVQQRTLTDDQLARLGGFALAVGTALWALSLAAADLIAGFYREPAVAGIVTVLSFTFLARAFQVLPRALLARELRFPRLAVIDGIETLTLVSVTLLLALLGAGYWALAFGSVASATAAAIALRVARPHRLALPRDPGSLMAAIRIGWQVSVSQVAWYVYSTADFAIVGRVIGKAALGAYAFGWWVASVPVERISTLLARVAPSIFAATQHDPRAVGRYFLGLTEGLALLTFPASAGIALVADEFVLTLLGDQWAAAIVPLRLLAMYAGVRSIMTLPPQLLTMTGHARITMWYSVLAALVLPALFIIGATWGLVGVAMAWIVGYPIVALPTFLKDALRVAQLPLASYVRALWPALSGTLVMVASVGLLRMATVDMPDGAALLLHVGAGVLTYAATIVLLHRELLGRMRALWRMVRA